MATTYSSRYTIGAKSPEMSNKYDSLEEPSLTEISQPFSGHRPDSKLRKTSSKEKMKDSNKGKEKVRNIQALSDHVSYR